MFFGQRKRLKLIKWSPKAAIYIMVWFWQEGKLRSVFQLWAMGIKDNIL